MRWRISWWTEFPPPCKPAAYIQPHFHLTTDSASRSIVWILWRGYFGRMKLVVQPVRVVLADRSLLVRERIAALLSVLVGVEVAGQAFNQDAALALVREFQPDVLVMDSSLCRLNCAEMIQTVKQQNPPGLVIILTNDPNKSIPAKYLQLGADFCFHKPFEFEKTLIVCQ